jgi:hypothetical protein
MCNIKTTGAMRYALRQAQDRLIASYRFLFAASAPEVALPAMTID